MQFRKTISIIRTGVRKVVRRLSRELSHELSWVFFEEISPRNPLREKRRTILNTDGWDENYRLKPDRRRMYLVVIVTHVEKVKNKVKVKSMR